MSQSNRTRFTEYNIGGFDIVCEYVFICMPSLI